MFDLDWPRVSRWCLLFTIVMTLWLLAPTAKCSWGAFRDTPLDEIQPDDPGQADKERVDAESGFFERWGHAIKGCYKQTPLLGQEPWKKDLLIGFGSLTVLAWSLGWWERKKKSSFADRR